MHMNRLVLTTNVSDTDGTSVWVLVTIIINITWLLIITSIGNKNWHSLMQDMSDKSWQAVRYKRKRPWFEISIENILHLAFNTW